MTDNLILPEVFRDRQYSLGDTQDLSNYQKNVENGVDALVDVVGFVCVCVCKMCSIGSFLNILSQKQHHFQEI